MIKANVEANPNVGRRAIIGRMLDEALINKKFVEHLDRNNFICDE